VGSDGGGRHDSSEGHEPAASRDAAPASGSPIPAHVPRAVGFLLSQLGFETARRFGSLMAGVELEPRQFALMRAIDAYQGQSQNAIGGWLRIPPSSMVAVIDHLETRGLVERRPHPSDRRSRTLHITDDGRQVLARATELAMGLEGAICQGFTGDERQHLLDMLARVADNLGLVQGLHPDTSTGHGTPHWTEEAGSASNAG